MKNNHHILLYLFIYLNISGNNNCGSPKVQLSATQKPHLMSAKIPPPSLNVTPPLHEEEPLRDSTTVFHQTENEGPSCAPTGTKYPPNGGSSSGGSSSGGSSSGGSSSGGSSSGGSSLCSEGGNHEKGTNQPENNDGTAKDDTKFKKSDLREGTDEVDANKVTDCTASSQNDSQSDSYYLLIEYHNHDLGSITRSMIALTYFLSLDAQKKERALLKAFNDDQESFKQFTHNICSTAYEPNLLSRQEHRTDAIVLGGGTHYEVAVVNFQPASLENGAMGNELNGLLEDEQVIVRPVGSGDDTTSIYQTVLHQGLTAKDFTKCRNDRTEQPETGQIRRLIDFVSSWFSTKKQKTKNRASSTSSLEEKATANAIGYDDSLWLYMSIR